MIAQLQYLRWLGSLGPIQLLNFREKQLIMWLSRTRIEGQWAGQTGVWESGNMDKQNKLPRDMEMLTFLGPGGTQALRCGAQSGLQLLSWLGGIGRVEVGRTQPALHSFLFFIKLLYFQIFFKF